MWELAVKTAKSKEDGESQKDTTLLFVGSKQSGKSTAIFRFLNRDEVPKPTLALEYTFGRQNRANELRKDMCNIWELGGGTLFSGLFDAVITPQQLPNLAVVIIVDLSQPVRILQTTVEFLKLIRSRVDKIRADPGFPDFKNESAIDETHPDFKIVKMFPFPVIILGGKYDIFQNFEPGNKKIICRTLRFLAHSNGASLHFFTSKVESLITRTKALLNNLAFGTALPSYISQDYNKPLMIPFGADTFSQIDSSGGKPNFAEWQKVYEETFGKFEVKTSTDSDNIPSKDLSYAEPAIDSLASQRHEELERYKRSSAT